MGGLREICRRMGGLVVHGADGKTVTYRWNYELDKPETEQQIAARKSAEKQRRRDQKAFDKKATKVRQGIFGI